MARLLKKNDAGESEVIELNLGVNHFGRDPECHFPIKHSTVSSYHCDIVLTAEGILLQDHDSTNGTYVNGERVKQAVLQPGQTVRLGDVELIVDSTEVKISIPEIERPMPPPPPVVLPGGEMLCPRHPQSKVTHRCTHCHSVQCDTCVKRLRRQGGKMLKLCVLCSHPVELILAEKPKKKGILSFITERIKLPFGPGNKPPAD
jgi:FHA domain